MASASFSLSLDESAGVLVVGGEVEEPAITELQEAIRTTTGGFARSVVLDLSAVVFLPSAALSVLVFSMRQASSAGHPIEFLAARGTIAQRILQISGLPHRTA